MAIFQDGGRRHFGFAKFQILKGRTRHECRTASLCQISSKSLEPLPRYVSFNIIRVLLKNAYSRPLLGVLGASDALMQELPCLSFMLLLLAYYCVHYAISDRRCLESLG